MLIDDHNDWTENHKNFTWKDFICTIKNLFPKYLIAAIIGGIEIVIIAGIVITISKCVASIKQNNVYLVTSDNCIACTVFESDNPFTKLNAFGPDFNILKIPNDQMFINDIQQQYGKPIENVPFLAYKDKNESWHIYYVVKDGAIDANVIKQFISDYNNEFNTSYVYNDKTNTITKGQS